MLKASQHQMKRAALSAESTNSTPPLMHRVVGDDADRLPVEPAEARRSARGANSGLTSKKRLGVDERRRSRVCMS